MNEPKISLLVVSLAGAILVGGLVMVGLNREQPDLGADVKTPVLEKMIDGKVRSVEYTDDNTNEELIIRAVDSEIMSFAGNTVVLFSVFNNSDTDQNVSLALSFGRDYDLKLYEDTGIEQVLVSPAMPATVSTTAKEAVYRERTIWTELSKKDFSGKLVDRKDLKGARTLKENSTFIRSGETKFFKAVVKYIPVGREEFIIEAFGETSYGHLDPWSYEQDFNDLTTGNLHLQDTWTGDTGYQVQTSETYEGAKAVGINPSSPSQLINRGITAISAGNFYIAVNQAGDDTHQVYLYESAAAPMGVRLDYATNNVDMLYESGFFTLDTYTDGVWGVINFEWDDSAQPDKYRVRFHDGTSWGSWTSWTTVLGSSYTQIDSIQFEAVDRTSGTTNYWDTITATDPTPAPATDSPKRVPVIIFE